MGASRQRWSRLVLRDASDSSASNGLLGSFKRFTSFQIEIYNRWGIPVFTSNDVTNTWDGRYQNTTVPNDTYTYRIYAKLNDGQEFNKSGKFVLFR